MNTPTPPETSYEYEIRYVTSSDGPDNPAGWQILGDRLHAQAVRGLDTVDGLPDVIHRGEALRLAELRITAAESAWRRAQQGPAR